LARRVESLYKINIRPEFGGCKLSTITRNAVIKWHNSMASQPVVANHAKAVLSRIFNFATEKGHNASNPAILVKNKIVTSRHRHASDSELKKIIAICYRELGVNTGDALFILTLIYTGARPQSISGGSQKGLEAFQRNGKNYGVLKFSGKSTNDTGQAEILFFPPALMGLYEYYGFNPLGHRSPRRFWERIRKEIGAHDLWMRDLRRTFASLGFNNGVGRGVIGELLNHKDEQTTKIYAKLHDSTRLDAIDTISRSIDELIYWQNTGN